MHKNPKRYSAPGNGALPPIGAALPKRGSSRCTCGSLVEAEVHRGRSPGASTTLSPEKLGNPSMDRFGARGNVVCNRVDGILRHGDLLCCGSFSLPYRDRETTD